MTHRCTRAIAFDFDGTLVDTNWFKRRAFFNIFESTDNSEQTVRFVLDHNPDLDRYGLIDNMLQYLSLPAKEAPNYYRKYTSTCEDFAANCPTMTGVETAIQQLTTHYSLHLNSATPEDCLVAIVKRRNWSQHFQTILGKPNSKVENLERLAATAKLSPQEITLVGDDKRDAHAAEVFGCRFIGFVSDSSNFDQLPEVWIKDMAKLPTIIT